MSVILGLLWLATIIGFFVGLIKPKLILGLLHLKFKRFLRLKLALIFIALFFVTSIAWGASVPPVPEAPSKPAPKQVAVMKPVPKVTPPKPTVDVTKVKGYLTDGTNYYVQLFQQAKDALGTTQYPDANAGLAAFNDPNSAANRWSKFNQSQGNATSDNFKTATKDYNNASNLYTAVNLDTPNEVNDWNNDINQAYTDLGNWEQDATSWQISEIPTSKLDGDAQKFQNDISTSQADITKL